MAISRLTGQDNTGSSATNSVSAAYASTPTAGNRLIACVSAKGAGSVSTITGWTEAVHSTVTNSITILYRDADGSESKTVTANHPSAVAMSIAIFEYSGLTTAAPDKTVTANSFSTVTSLPIGPTATLSQTVELAVAALAVGNTFSAPGWTNSFNARATVSVTNTGLITADRIVAATTALSTTASWTTARAPDAAIATFKGAAVAATLAAPLGSLTAAITATPTVAATLAAPLGGLTATIAAKPTVLATLAAPLGALTATATATPTVNATLAAPLGALTATATATPKVNATLAAPLGGLTASITATPTVLAALAAPLGSLTATLTASSVVTTVDAVLAAPLGSLTATALATPYISATLTAPLGSLTATASATPKVLATFAAPLGALTASLSATVTVSATMQALLGGLTATLIATVELPVAPVLVRYFDSTATAGHHDGKSAIGHHDGKLAGTSTDDSTATGTHHDGVLTATGRREGVGP